MRRIADGRWSLIAGIADNDEEEIDAEEEAEFSDSSCNGRGEMSEDAFYAFYAESNWAKPMLSGAFEQLEETVREQRNQFLLKTMQLPEEQWGFEQTGW